MGSLHYRAIWISDLHLGTRDAKSDYLLDFLANTETDYLYLVGDILDLWKLKSWYWPEVNNRLVELVQAKAKGGTRVIYVPGNHDEKLRDFVGSFIGGVHIQINAIHESADGRRFLVLHGDEFDCVVMHNRWLAHIGDKGYEALLRLNHWYNVVRRRLGFSYWSLSAYIKNRVKEAVNYIGNFEQAVVAEAERHRVDGLICGHIHHASMRRIDGVSYNNCGDWVESCTALVEEESGELSIIHWTEQGAELLDARERSHETPVEEELPLPLAARADVT